MSTPKEEFNDHVLLENREVNTEPPRMHKVIMHNDDYTPMEFVVWVLQAFFRKDADEAYQIMMMVHQQGKAVCGVYPKDIAVTKSMQVITVAKENGHPLQCTTEEI